jgi:hypothetical protein
MQAQAAAAQNLLDPEFFYLPAVSSVSTKHKHQQFSAKAKGKDYGGGWGCC